MKKKWDFTSQVSGFNYLPDRIALEIEHRERRLERKYYPNTDRKMSFITALLIFDSSAVLLLTANIACLFDLYQPDGNDVQSLQKMNCTKRGHLEKGINYSFLSAYLDQFGIQNIDSNLLFNEQGYWKALNQVMAVKRFDLAELLYEQLKVALNQKPIGFGRNESDENFIYPQRLFVMGMELMASRVDEFIDWEAAEVPIDPFYKLAGTEAVHEQDQAKVDEWFIALADKHLEHSTNDSLGEQSGLLGWEFDTPLDQLWPYEIHALARVREERGYYVPNLKSLDHVLFQQKAGHTLVEYNPAYWEIEPWFERLLPEMIKREPELAHLGPMFLTVN